MENIELLKLFETVNNWDFPREFPGDDILVYAFMFIFLGSTMYSMYKLLDRNNLSENLLPMVVPYLLLLVFIVPQSLITIGIFLDTAFISQSVIMELMGSHRAVQCLTITAFMWAVTACILLYAALFGRKTCGRLFDGERAMDFLNSYTRSVYSLWAGAMVSIASLLTWLLLSPEKNGKTLLETMDFTTICVLIWLIPSVIILMISIFFIIFSKKSPQMKGIAKWGTGDMDAEKWPMSLSLNSSVTRLSSAQKNM